jgi:hypothetical protein
MKRRFLRAVLNIAVLLFFAGGSLPSYADTQNKSAGNSGSTTKSERKPSQIRRRKRNPTRQFTSTRGRMGRRRNHEVQHPRRTHLPSPARAALIAATTAIEIRTGELLVAAKPRSNSRKRPDTRTVGLDMSLTTSPPWHAVVRTYPQTCSGRRRTTRRRRTKPSARIAADPRGQSF